jgi:ectoine hydroxylase
MGAFRLSAEQVAQFNKDGYVLMKGLFDEEEAGLLRAIAKADRALASDARGAMDAQGDETRLAVRNTLSQNDIYSAIVRCPRMVNAMEQFLEGEVYHYHHKMMLKESHVGGAWEWHQDYGYWYNNGCLYPLMASCMIAVDRATRENGCLQVLRGSHHLGRIDHGEVGRQTGADAERVAEIMKRFERVYCELDPGDAVYFHCNLLHRSDANHSEHPRWSLICCYNAARNDPYLQHHHPNYAPLEKVRDHKVKEIGRKQWEAIQAVMAR